MKKELLKIIILTGLFTTQSVASGFVAHEWGTFTSVVNKEGKMLQGLHHEEEALPRFVYDLSRIEKTNRSRSNGRTGNRRNIGGPVTRGFTPISMDLMPIPTFTERITQKMETPVIYFYTEKEIDVEVRVDFPKGIISQWYPKVSKINPSIEAKNGYGVWDVKVLEDKTINLPQTSGNSIWNPSRETNANIVKAGAEVEKLIFYRGLGDFDTPLKVLSHGDRVTITNNSEQVVKGLILLNHRDGVNEFTHVSKIDAYSKVTVKSTANKFKSYEGYLEAAKKVIVNYLVNSGLYEDESIAMVKTWEEGYFKTKGLRLLYLLPSKWTEDILPMKMTPSPKNLVRTLVGRIEILNDVDDKKILAFVNSKVANDELTDFEINGKEIAGLGHFPEPKLRRALDFDLSDVLKRKINAIIKTMNTGFLN